MPPTESHSKGLKFEEYIASIYESLGFLVTVNVRIQGHQVDLVAEKIIKGIGKIKTFIECKYLSKGNVGNQAIYEFANFVMTLQKAEAITTGVIVTNRGYSEMANMAATNLNLQLLTQEELESQHFHYERKEVATEVEMLGLTLVDDTIKFITLKNGEYSFIDSFEQFNRIYLQCSFESLQYRVAIEELEFLINNLSTKESELQNFFERFPNFIMNDEYKKAHSQIILESLSEDRKLIPDFILEPINPNGLADILDIKLPKTKIYSLTKNREGFSSSVLKACFQLREYGHFFNDSINREKVYKKYNLKLFEPKMIVVIGRRGNLDPSLSRRIENDIPRLQIKTYDDLIEKIKFKYR